nr:hypothetical protein CFP56_66872 [Quercus suber]
MKNTAVKSDDQKKHPGQWTNGAERERKVDIQIHDRGCPEERNEWGKTETTTGCAVAGKTFAMVWMVNDHGVRFFEAFQQGEARMRNHCWKWGSLRHESCHGRGDEGLSSVS